MNRLDQIVHIVLLGQVVASSIRDLDGYIEETTTPRGVGPIMHLRGAELWSWGHQGSNPHLVAAYDSEAEAQDALEETFAWDFWNGGRFYPVVFTRREDAETYLQDLQASQDSQDGET